MNSNGLTRLAGTWSDAEHEEFVAAIEPCSEIDDELWRVADTEQQRD